MKTAQAYATVKLIGLCFVAVLMFWILDSRAPFKGNWVWTIFTAASLSVMAVLFEKWNGIRW